MADLGMYNAPGQPQTDDQAQAQAPAQQAQGYGPPQGYGQTPTPGGLQPQQPPPGPPRSPYQQTSAYGPPQGPPQQTPAYGAPQQTATPAYGAPPGPPRSPYQQTNAYGPPPSTSPFPPPQQASPYGAPPQQQYGQPPQQQQAPYGGDVGGIAQGMAGMDLQPGTISKASRKKQRAHAYHQLDQAPDSNPGNLPAFSPNVGDNLQQGFLSGPTPQQQMPQSPGIPQFPLPAAPSFVPQQAADPAAFHARQPAGMNVSQQGGKVDAMAIPSVPRARDAAIQHFRQTVFPTLARHLPPNAASDFVAQDQGNASPKFCRLTVNAVPTTAELLASTHLPLALLLQPLAKLRAEEEPIPVLDFGEMGPPRCRRCRTYINPFMTFVQGGSKFRCNMCLFPNNEVPNEYYAPVDMAGVRVDREQRPELTRGTVEFVVPKEYWANKEGADSEGKGGAPMRYLFLVDATEGAVNRGTLEAVTRGIKEALYGESAYEPVLEGQEAEDGMEGKKRRLPKGCKVGICTFDKDVHFYNLNPALDQAQMVVMPDIEEPFVPFDEGLFVDPYESRNVIEPLLDSLPGLFIHIKNPEPALQPVLQAALQALQKTGGKIICSLATIPTWGPHRLVLREDSKLYGSEKEKQLFKTENQAWRQVAGKMVEAGVGVDFFLTPSAYIDVATIGHVSATTGGELYLYPNFVVSRDSHKLGAELSHAFHRTTGYQALMKVRCSTGLQVTAYHGNFLQVGGSAADVEFGTVDEDKAIAVMFSHDGKLDPQADAHFQSALLYTTQAGERRVRCSNTVAAVTEVARDAVRWADQDAVLGVLAREAAAKMLEKPLKEIRGALTEKCIEILAAYRKHCVATGTPPGQLILPESLKEFSMYVLGLLKSRAFRPGSSVSSDLRTHSMRLFKSLPAPDLQLYLYPRILPLHTLADGDGFPDDSGHLALPAALRASFAFVDDGGAYLVDNGAHLLLWLHAHVSPHLLSDLFGPDVTALTELDPMLYELPVLETALNAQVRNIVAWVASQRGARKVAIQLARQGLDGAEYEFANALVEDRNCEERAYVDWLVHVHKYVQLEVSGERRKADEGMGIGAGLDAAQSGMAGLRPGYW
ncbi:hypothetical protein EDC01DRAFT_680536 [Geopyxis carbonaria]|nr:hypothetical protein EDC01DRAFT_680536 [Geopyxis carbonaria]